MTVQQNISTRTMVVECLALSSLYGLTLRIDANRLEEIEYRKDVQS